MAEATHVIPNENCNLVAVRQDWGCLTRCRPVFRQDGNSFLLAADSTVKVICTKTGSVLKEFLHNSNVVGISEHMNSFVACTDKGEVTFWDTNSGKISKSLELLRENSLGGNIVNAFYIIWESMQVFLHIKRDKLSTVGRLLSITGNDEIIKYELMAEKILMGQGKFSISHNHKYVAHLTTTGLHITGNGFKVKGKGDLRHNSGTRVFTCVVWHPAEESLATADDTGRIILWNNPLDFRPVKTILHWHTLQVQDLVYSPLGNHLYSGGGESVLVKWLLTEQEKTKVFLPRLGMPIVSITCDPTNEHVLAGTIEDSYAVISSRAMHINGIIQNMTVNTDSQDPQVAGIVYEPRTGGVLLNGKLGHLQVFDIYNNKQLYQLDIMMRNYISQERSKKIYNLEVIKMAVSTDGKWMASVEFRNDFETSFEMRLKFWQYKEESQSWTLNTCIDMPHNKCINGVIFEPTQRADGEQLCLTCADDGKFKIWEMVAKPISGGDYWACRRIGFYKHLPATAVNMSPDSSLIAAGFDSVLTFWLPESCHFKGTLSQPYLRERIRQIEFGRGEGSASFIVTRTENWICSWDFFSCSLVWRVGIQSTCLAADPLSSHMAIFSKDQNVFIFEPQSSIPVCWKKNINESVVLHAAFVPRQSKKMTGLDWNMHSSLVFLDQERTLQTVEESSTIEEEVSKRVRQFEQDTRAKPAPTPFSALIAETQVSHVTEETKSQKGTAKYGLNVESSAMFIQEIMNGARVYRMESFADMVTEFSHLLIPEAVTSEEKRKQIELQEQLRESKVKLDKKKKSVKIQKKKDIERVTSSNFAELVEMLT